MTETDKVLVVGAGPVGFTVALNLAHHGIPFTLLEADSEISEDPRAGTIHPPTLEMFDRLGLNETIFERGYVVPNYHYRQSVETRSPD